MKQYAADKIRNFAVAGHAGSGKTSLTEAILYLSGGTNRLGKVSDGNTVCDFDKEEKSRKITISASVAPVEWEGGKLNFIDTPGIFDFEESLVEAVRAVENVLIVVSAKSGVAVGTEKAFKAAEKRGRTKFFFINGMVDESNDYYDLFEQLSDRFGTSVIPVVVPYIQGGKAAGYINIIENKAYVYQKGKLSEIPMPDMSGKLDDIMTAIHEAVAETDEELMEKYFGGEEFTSDELLAGVTAGVKQGLISPVFCGDALTTEGVDLLLNGLSKFAPTAAENGAETAETESGDKIEIAANEGDPTVLSVFKTVVDAYLGKLAFFKVVSGKVSQDINLINMRTGNNERMGKIYSIKGEKTEDIGTICAGDIGVTAKLAATSTGDTLADPARKVILDGITPPNSPLTKAIYPKVKGEEDKIAQGLLRLIDEDPSIRYEANAETHQMLVSGLGETHLDVVVAKLRSKFGVEVTLETPRVAYREAIRKKVQVQGRHKKQSGGHGQFGDVWVEFEPCDSEGLEFGNRVVGGSVPKGYFPAVEKGLREAMQRGPLAGYPMVGLRATLFDGSYHPVDSSEAAFKMAASIAYKNGMPSAAPTLLEPIAKLKAQVPDDNMGDILGEINKRRGSVMGMNPSEEAGQQEIEAEVPMAEMHDFSTFVRQVTQGRGTYVLTFERYQDAPPVVSQKVIEEAKALAEAEAK